MAEKEQLELELMENRAKKLYKKIQGDLANARTQYVQNNNAELANLLIQLAQVESQILIAERLDMIAQILIKNYGLNK